MQIQSWLAKLFLSISGQAVQDRNDWLHMSMAIEPGFKSITPHCRKAGFHTCHSYNTHPNTNLQYLTPTGCQFGWNSPLS
jgi:hypothetical protein